MLLRGKASVALAMAAICLLPAAATAQRRVPLPSPMPPVVYAPCPDDPTVEGCTYWVAPFTIYLSNHRRFIREHELGHAFDQTMMSDGERNRFRTLTHQRTAPWWKLEEGEYSRASVGEQFADAYANCAIGNGSRRLPSGMISDRWETSTSYSPSPRTHRRVCAFIRRAAR